MWKFFLILLLGLLFESAGIVLLRSGLKDIRADVRSLSLDKLPVLIKHAACTGRVWLGMTCQALYFFSLLFLLSRKEVSFVWPMTSLGFVISALAAKLFLSEPIGWLRWGGIILIMAGAALISYTEQQTAK